MLISRTDSLLLTKAHGRFASYAYTYYNRKDKSNKDHTQISLEALDGKLISIAVRKYYIGTNINAQIIKDKIEKTLGAPKDKKSRAKTSPGSDYTFYYENVRDGDYSLKIDPKTESQLQVDIDKTGETVYLASLDGLRNAAVKKVNDACVNAKIEYARSTYNEIKSQEKELEL